MSTKEWRQNNKEHIKRYKNSWYKRNSKRIIEKARLRTEIIKGWLRAYKSTLKCSRCSENDWRCLDFHHINPQDKESSIAYAIRDGWSIERIQLEITKCIVLCANCHRKETFKDLW